MEDMEEVMENKLSKEQLVQQVKMFAEVGLVVVEAVKDMGPTGMPAGTLYAALMAKGCSLQTFQRIMDLLVEAGRLRHANHVYYFVR